MNFERAEDAQLDVFTVQRRLRLARELVEARELAAQAKNKTRYDKRRREQTFHPGDLVYVWSPTRVKSRTTKLLHQYHGPYQLVRQTAENNWEIQDRRGKKTDIVNVERLKPFHARHNYEDDTDGQNDESDEDLARDPRLIGGRLQLTPQEEAVPQGAPVSNISSYAAASFGSPTATLIS
ncbi:hypothetical protein IscW_ISCW012686 [Ixodes scapularis]|uniref:Integrase p58-like C-terminal domain-containing protein n=1 Tax=Ixodes scapularis TaxID=6945 RepID=B7QG01_IXOSC|nr:hypothetical protein IscW_ISCW012686 [Ixodes scapularis]|eukprot:XP_002401066.1 hypothetical protein IscW_ISCW012686 [Ixodes scapularis]